MSELEKQIDQMFPKKTINQIVAGDIENRYQYWIDLGAQRERERITNELDFFWDQLTQLMAVGYSQSAKQLLIQAITPRGGN